MPIEADSSIAVWALTPNGLDLAGRLLGHWPGAVLFCARHLSLPARPSGARRFDGLSAAVAENFHVFEGHIFIMAVGIVVRAIAPMLRHKTVDPAVVVTDDQGGFAISLVSGHIGGANRLTRQVAEQLKSVPVITTATEVNGKPAIDLLAVDRGMAIENPECIKTVNLALLSGEPVRLHDPAGWLEACLPGEIPFSAGARTTAAVWVDDTVQDLEPRVLVLRPPPWWPASDATAVHPQKRSANCWTGSWRRFLWPAAACGPWLPSILSPVSPDSAAWPRSWACRCIFMPGKNLPGSKTPPRRRPRCVAT